MPLRRPIRSQLHAACAALLLTLHAHAAVAGVLTPAASAFALRHTLLATSEAAPQPTSAATLGAAPKKSKRTWLYVGLAALAVGGAVALAGGGDSKTVTPLAPIDPPPPPPPAAAHGGVR